MIALTIGVFDGVHLGHQRLFQHLRSTGLRTVALAFSNHPATILSSASPLPLTPAPIKFSLLAEQVDEPRIVPFTSELAALSYEDFLSQFPTLRHLVLGEDAALGKNRSGTPDAIRLLGLKRGFTVEIVPKLQSGGQPISSTRIRQLILDSKLADAAALLGRPHCFLCGSSEPTLLPPDGVYAVWAESIAPTTLTIKNGKPECPLEGPCLLKFEMENLCQISPAAL